MTKKEMLENVKSIYKSKGCSLIELVHEDGTRSGIANKEAIDAIMNALYAELDSQIAEEGAN